MPNTDDPPEEIPPDDRPHAESGAAATRPPDGHPSALAAADGVELDGINEAVDTLSLLADETRLSILLALWEAYDPYAADNAVSFSELRDRVGVSDSGHFNYHLGRLDGQFIRNTEDGYELRTAGHKLLVTVIAETAIEAPTLDPTELDGGP